MDHLRKVDFSKYLERAQLYSQENPFHAGAAALALLGSAYMLLCPKRKLNVVPGQSIIVITGCDSGFGLMTSKKLSAMGYLVVAACLQEKSVAALKGVVALPIQCDITKDADVQRLVKSVKELASEKKARVWAIVNNAGIASSGNIDLVSKKACRQVMEVNFFALFEVTRAFLPMLKQTKDSRIINISSAAGLVGSYQLGVYCASKHAVEGFGKVLRQELAPWNIHVAHINPGFMRTPIFETAFDSSVRDIADAPADLIAQYDAKENVTQLKKCIDLLLDDPNKVVNKIVENITLARPVFNNPVGNGVYTFWSLLCFLPQRVVWGCLTLGNRLQGFGPTPEALQRIQTH